VSTSAYYEWLHRSIGPTASELEEAHLINQIRVSFPPNRGGFVDSRSSMIPSRALAPAEVFAGL